MRMRRGIRFLIAAVFIAALAIVAYRVQSRRIYIWLPAYLAQPAAAAKPTDIMLLIADHYEPGKNDGMVDEWVREYPKLFGDIRDSDGRPPRHTFFYPAEQFKLSQLVTLNALVREGYGEIELHLHHKDDTSASLREKLRQAKQDFLQAGALHTPDGQPHFGFVHGNWALDNSVGEGPTNVCGVNDEITILREEGAFADFTFPAYETTAQPPIVNQIYYAWDDPTRPKSYAAGEPVRVGARPRSEAFLILQGPIGLRWFTPWYRLFPVVEFGGMEGDPQTMPEFSRFDHWLRANVHVQGRPEWVFIKWHTHGAYARDKRAVLSAQMADLYRQIAEYGRSQNVRIHFVTAREAYNILKAAESGRAGDAGQFRDFVIPPYKNVSAPAGETRR